LQKAHDLNPSDFNTAHDLAIVYARRFQIQKGIEVLERNNPTNDFWNYWFWLKLKVLSGDTNEVTKGLNQLKTVLDTVKNQEETAFPRQKIEEIRELLARFNQVQAPRIHIQDWQFIQYGSIMLDFFEDTEDYVAGGRYVATWGSNQSIKELTNRLKIYLKAFNLDFEGIRYLEGRNSEIIGLATAKEMALSSKVYNPEEDNKNCLIIAANSSDFNDYQELSKVKDGQLVFALNHSWLEAASITPDIIGFMSQSYYFPWDGGGFNLNMEKGKTEKTAPDKRRAAEIAEDIFQEKVEEQTDKAKLNFYLNNRDYLKAIGSKVNNHRFNFMVESPVPGSFFG